jgi:hypothetical protein
MWQAIWKLAIHRTGLWYLVVVTPLAGYTLLKTDPLGSSDPVAALLGAALGCVLAFCLFGDPPGVAAFVFSRPFSRRRLFLYRWLIGLGFQAITILAIVVLLAGGVRQWIHVSLYHHPLWYPMVRWYELTFLWPVVGTSLFAYQATLLVMVRNRLLRSSRPKYAGLMRALRTIVDVMLIGAFAIALLLGALWTVRLASTGVPSLPAAPLVLPYLALVTVMTTLGGLSCYGQLEVEA